MLPLTPNGTIVVTFDAIILNFWTISPSQNLNYGQDHHHPK